MARVGIAKDTECGSISVRLAETIFTLNVGTPRLVAPSVAKNSPDQKCDKKRGTEMSEIQGLLRAISDKDQEIIACLYGNLYGKGYTDKLKRLREERRTLVRRLKQAKDDANQQNVLF